MKCSSLACLCHLAYQWTYVGCVLQHHLCSAHLHPFGPILNMAYLSQSTGLMTMNFTSRITWQCIIWLGRIYEHSLCWPLFAKTVLILRHFGVVKVGLMLFRGETSIDYPSNLPSSPLYTSIDLRSCRELRARKCTWMEFGDGETILTPRGSTKPKD